jgi:cyclopropane-fatty-acyl-phospholipid synthase
MKNNEPDRLGLPGGGEWNSHTASSSTSYSLVTGFERWLARRVAKYLGDPPISIALWDGENAYRPNVRAVGRMTFRDRGALWSAVASPELGMGDAYSEGRLEVSGDLVEVLFHVFRGIAQSDVNAFKRSLLGRLPRARSNTLTRSRTHIEHHYDLGNDFYRLWLDENMVYTCAYYTSPEASLEEAQIAKMDHVCRKVMLKPGMSVIEAGCGWGALALHMARHYGVNVKAFNISRSQIAYARERAATEGLSRHVEFIEDDYRNCSGKFDAFVSVGMLEHVGPDRYGELGAVINRVLQKDGLGIIHSVGRSRPTAPNAWLEQRIFPGSYPPSLREMMDIFEPYDFSIMDVENLRLHYARTLMEWLERFDRNVDTVRESYDEAFVRAWRLYLGGCAAAFLASAIQLFQVVFAFPDHNAIPMTREHVYGAVATPKWRFD